jgi:hypothetical protein
MPASLIIFVHFSSWTLRCASSSSGELENASKPRAAIFALISELSMILRSSVLSLTTTSRGVPAGANSPAQESMSKPVSPASG